MEKVILIGAGGHSRVVLDAALYDENIEITGFLDDGDIDEILGVKKLGNISEIERFKDCKFHIAIGNNLFRKELAEKVGFENLITIVHPTAVISRDVQIGKGCYIGANVVINSKAIVEDIVIVNTRSVVEHDCILKEASHLSYGVLLGSSVSVEKSIYIEMGSVVGRGIKVERDIR
ncbi:MAG: acetyltransferase [Cetobacterium sp.]